LHGGHCFEYIDCKIEVLSDNCTPSIKLSKKMLDKNFNLLYELL